jgi:hypothetical protein
LGLEELPALPAALEHLMNLLDFHISQLPTVFELLDIPVVVVGEDSIYRDSYSIASV